MYISISAPSPQNLPTCVECLKTFPIIFCVPLKSQSGCKFQLERFKIAVTGV